MQLQHLCNISYCSLHVLKALAVFSNLGLGLPTIEKVLMTFSNESQN